jgi:hypothetical protein
MCPEWTWLDWSGRRGSNPRRPAWEAGILPLNYSRSLATFKFIFVLPNLQANLDPSANSTSNVPSANIFVKQKEKRMNWMELIKVEMESAYSGSEKLLAKATDPMLGWKPSTGSNWMSR